MKNRFVWVAKNKNIMEIELNRTSLPFLFLI